jgi:hypothetical protein
MEKFTTIYRLHCLSSHNAKLSCERITARWPRAKRAATVRQTARQLQRSAIRTWHLSRGLDILPSPNFPMESERSFEEIVSARKESAAESLRSATPEDLRKSLDEIFSADPSHPWHKSFTQFVEDHKDETAYRGETSDEYSFVFYPRTGRGMWYRFDTRLSGVGIISDNTMKFLTQLVK